MVSPVSNIPPQIARAIDSAGDKSGVDFNYLVDTAMRESSMNPEARAPTSSATGLFQFIESTWLEVMKTEGPELGYGAYADQISQRGGRFVVDDPQARRDILALRTDPQVSSDLAAAFTRRNGALLQERFGRMPSPGELYIAHFMGPSGAQRFFEAGLNQPDAKASELFPRPARANPSIFYDDGRARTVREVYEVLVARHHAQGAGQPQPQFAAQQMAGGQGQPHETVPSRYAAQEAALPPGVSFTEMFSTQPGGSGGASPLTREDRASPGAAPQSGALFDKIYSGP